MSQLVCPLCSESLNEEGAHFFKHFKYKRYACGTNNCDHQFYTEADREVHCTTHNHKRSFQKTVNPYIDKMIEMIVHDARELATTGMDTVIENRFGGVQASKESAPSSSSASGAPGAPGGTVVGRKRSTVATPSTTPATKKKRTSGTTTAATVSRARGSNASPPLDTSGGAVITSSVRTPAAPPASSAPAQRVRTSSNIRAPPTPTTPPAIVINSSSEVDSTTSDHNLPVEKTVPAPKPPSRQRKKPSESSSGSGNAAGIPPNRSYESMTAAEKLTGYYDRNAPGLADALKTTCTVCKMDVVIDFLVRMEHTTSKHMAADVAEEDYNDILKAEMDRCYPEFPNSKLACQQCVDGPDISKKRRREHVESKHHTSLQDLSALKCPIDACGMAFIRQCELSSHMKENHKLQMCQHKDIDFQYNRARRNKLLDATLKICFPWSEVEKIEHTSTSNDSNRTNTSGIFNFSSDVRLRDASRIRRAAQYNQKDTDSTDSDDSDAEDETATTDKNNKNSQIEEQDVIFISRKFNEAVLERLRQRAGSVKIKQEVVEEEQKEKDWRVAGEPPKEEAPDATVEENPGLSTTRYAIPMIASSYEPIVVPPPAGSPDPVVTPPSLFSLHSQGTRSSPDDNGQSTEQPSNGSPQRISAPWSPNRSNDRSYGNGSSSSSSYRPRHYENRGTSDSWKRGEGSSTSSTSYNNSNQNYNRRPYSTHSYRPSSSYRGSNGGSSSSSSSSTRYGSTAYSNRNFNNNNTNNSTETSGASTSSSSSSSRHRDYQGGNPSRILPSSSSNTHRFFSDSSSRDRSSRY